jgi:hypothetical protein
MSRPIAYNASGPLSGSIRGGSVNYTVDSGNRDYTTFASKKWVPSADGIAPIVFVTDSYTQGLTNQTDAYPLFYSCTGTGSAAILYTANRIPGSPGNYSDANVALNDLINARGYFILESNDPFEGIDADSLLLDVDASKMSSYPQVGTNWRDLSGQGNTAALTNGPVWNSSGWFNFDGTDDYGYNGSTSLNITGNVTLNAWVRNNGTGTNVGNYMSKAQNNGYRMRRNGTSGSPLWLYSFGNTINGGAIYDNIWYMVTGVFSDTGLRAYINGTLVASNSTPYSPSSLTLDGLYIGAYTNGAEYFGGDIVNAQVYASALTEAQVKQNYFGSPIVTDGLVFAVDANNIVSYPKSGTSWFNLTGSGAGGTLNNGPTFNPNNGGSIVFDGTDDFANFNGVAVTSTSTVSFWVNFITTTGTVDRIYSTSPIDNFEVGIDTNGLISYYPNGGGDWQPTSISLSKNIWTNLAFSFSGGNISVYKNGILSYTGTTNASAGINTFLARRYAGSEFVNCQIANAKIYNKALSAAEIQQNYQAEQYRFETSPGIPTNGLILHLDAANRQSYPGSGTVWYDISGQGANADLVNGVTWNSSGYFFFDGTDDIANSINISQDYRDLVIGIWSESDGSVEMVFSLFGGFDASFRLGDNLIFSANNNDDWQFGSNNLVFVDGAYTPDANLASQFHFVRTYRSNNADFGTSFRYSLSSTFLGRFFKGKIAFVLSYNRQLSDAEVRGLYYYYKDRFPF